MAEQFNSEHLADVIPIFRHRQREEIAGRMLDLLAMSVQELKLLEEQCLARVYDANHDLAVVQEYIEVRGEA